MTAAVQARANTDRILRTFARFVDVGYLAYLVLLLDGIRSAAAHLQPWWTPVAVVVVFGPGLALGVVSFTTSVRALRIVASSAAIAFLVVVASAYPAWNGQPLPADHFLWLTSFPGLAALAAVLSWPTWLAFVDLVVACVAVHYVNFLLRGSVGVDLLIPDTAFAIVFSSLFFGGVAMALRTGHMLDATTEQAYAAASEAAAQRSQAVERERLDGLVHDTVLATLLAAERGGEREAVRTMASIALAELDDLDAADSGAASFDVREALAHLRTAANGADPEAVFAVTGAAPVTGDYPSAAIRALGAALAEALRNSCRHAGDGAQRAVAVTLAADSATVEVSDDGVGFDPALVPPHRLGVAVSIRGRMTGVDGGSAVIDSAPGAGTRVRLGWERR